jgi:serine/threonine-protein kinase RsbW
VMASEPAVIRSVMEIDLSCLDRMHQMLSELWESVPSVPIRDQLMFATAVAEIAANVIDHAPPSRTQWELELRAWSDRIEALFSDDGPAFDISTSDAPPDDAPRGRGLALAHAVADVHYERREPNNEWRIVRYIASEG